MDRETLGVETGAPTADTLAMLERAEGFLRKGEYAECIEAASQAAISMPNYFRPHVTIGLAWWRQGDMLNAAESFATSALLNPRHFDSCLYAGRAYMAQSNYQAARKMFEAATNADRHSTSCRVWLAHCLQSLGDFDEANNIIHSTAAQLDWMLPKNKRISFQHAPWFLNHIQIWRDKIQPYIPKNGKLLEIGSMEAMSTLWMASELIDSHGIVVSADIAYRDSYASNIRASGLRERIISIVGSSVITIPLLLAGSFDFVYVDGDHSPEMAFADGVNALLAAKQGGIVCFDDYKNQNQDTALGVDTLVQCFGQNIDFIHEGYQLIVRRKSDSLVVDFPNNPKLASNMQWREAIERSRVQDFSALGSGQLAFSDG